MTAYQPRESFSSSRASDFLRERELALSMSVGPREFLRMAVKELLDNALDAAEVASGEPQVSLEVAYAVDPVTEATVEITVVVTDNGAGIPAAVIDRLLDFDVRTSDKAPYRTPTRGQQGNATKTVLGVAYLLGEHSVVFETRGRRHTLRAELIGDDDVETHHETGPSDVVIGTKVTLTVTAELAVDSGLLKMAFSPRGLLFGYALANPHVSVSLITNSVLSTLETADGRANDLYEYKSTAPKTWRKYVAKDFGSPLWYDLKSFEGLVNKFAGLAEPPTPGQFLERFTGLKGPRVRAQIRREAGLETYQMADLKGRDHTPGLLKAMQDAVNQPPINQLGPLGEAHLLERLHRQGVGLNVRGSGVAGRHWYKRSETDVDGVPWVCEVLVCETAGNDLKSYWLMNHSVLVGDPIKSRLFGGGDSYKIAGTGVTGLFTASHLDGWGDFGGLGFVTVVHLICPRPQFIDTGKTAVDLPAEVADDLGEAVWATTKKVWKEHAEAVKDAQRQRDAAARARETAAGVAKPPKLRAAVMRLIPEAYRLAGGETAPVSSRTILYKMRPLVAKAGVKRELKKGYFNDLLAEYDREHPGMLPNLYYEARGELVEPHTGKRVKLGTREVAAYDPDPHLYDKLLYIEKAGLEPVFEAARFKERFDMGVVYGSGFAVVAARELADRLQTDRDTKLFILHDADASGYQIAITYAEETARMPDHHIEVIDLGLTWTEAMAEGLESEPHKRVDALSERLVAKLEVEEPAALKAFTGKRDGTSWAVQRVELNAFSSPALIAYVERKLRENGADEKFFPPEEVAEELAIEAEREVITARAKRWLAEAFDIDAIIETLVAEFGDEAPEDLAGVMRRKAEEDRAAYWRRTVESAAEEKVDGVGDALRDRFDELLDERG